MAIAGPSASTTELAPRLHLRAPSHLLHLLEDIDEGIRLDAPNTALRALRQAFAFLLGLCCDILGTTAVMMGASAELFILEKGQAPRLSDMELRIKEALYFLSQRSTDDPLALGCQMIFFAESGEPRQFYLLTQGGKVEGMLGGLKQLSEFCKEPSRAPGRSESFKLRTAYLPHLEAWLESLNGFWEKSQLLWERTDLDGQVRLLYRIHGQDLEVGARLNLCDCKACIPSRVLKAPEGWVTGEAFLGVPQEVPEHTLHLVDRFCRGLDERDVVESTRLLRDTLEFLLRYFAGVGKMLCQEFGCLSDEAERLSRRSEGVESCESLLQTTVEALKSHQDDAAAKDFVGVFYRRDANLELQPRSHTNVLLLEGVLSAWFKQERGQQPDAKRYAKDFERFFPIFRDWVRSMGPFFSHTEHFADEPTPEGQLPITVRCGEHLLELLGQEYNLRIRQCPVCLPNPIWAQQAAQATKKQKAPPTQNLTAEQLLRRANTVKDEPSSAEPEEAPEVVPQVDELKTFPGEFRPLDMPPDVPKFLGRILRRLDVRLRRGELPQSRDALRDAMDYLLRYWAGVSFAGARELGKLSIEEEENATKNLGISDCEKLLNANLKRLSQANQELSEEILNVFYERDPFTEQLKSHGGHTRLLLADDSPDSHMQLLSEFCEMTDPCDLHRSRRDLRAFLPVLRDWLKSSQGFFEQCQHHEEEPDREGRMELVVQWDKTYLELVAPDYSFYTLPGADLVPDLPVPEWVEPAEAKVEAEVVKPKIITSEALALSEPFLIHRVQYVGLQPNSKGASCVSGIISIQNAGGGSLTGRAFSNHPCIEVSPNRFREKNTLHYWLDEKSIPRDFIPVLILRSGGDERQVTLAELRPLSRFSTLSKSQGKVLLYAPVVAGFFLVNIVIIRQAKRIQGEMANLLTGSSNNGKNTAKLKDNLEVYQACQAHASPLGGLFLLYAAFSSVLTLIIYRRFSHSLQDLLIQDFNRALMAPIITLLLTMALNVLVFPVCRHPEIRAANLLALTPWAIVFCVGGGIYSVLDQERKFAEWVQEPALRKLIPLSILALFLILWTLALT